MKHTKFPDKREKDDVLEKCVCPQMLCFTCYMHRKQVKLVDLCPVPTRDFSEGLP